MYTLITHLSDVSTKYYSIYTVLLHFFVILQTNIRPLIREDHLMGAFFLDDVIVGNDIN